MKYASVCSGIEAPTAAWHPLGWTPVWFSQFDPEHNYSKGPDFASAVLAHHYPRVQNLGDMTKLHSNEVFNGSEFDVLVGGTPCQSFSVAGLRAGLDDPRGNLALEFVRILATKRPRWFVWENVPGVLSSSGGRDFAAILGAFEKVGYHCAWRVLDAQYFGVPQRRRRVFVVGHFGDWRRAAAVLFERPSVPRDIKASGKAREGIAADIGAGVGETVSGKRVFPTLLANIGTKLWSGNQEAFSGDYFIKHALGIRSANTSSNGCGIQVEKTHTIDQAQPHAVCYRTNAAGQVDNQGQKTAALTTMTDPTTQFVAFAENSRNEFRLENGDGQIVGALNRGGGKPGHGYPAIADNFIVRRLTPRECERLQGFPDNYTNIPWRDKIDSPDTARYKAIGNSMAVPVMRWIGRRIDFVDKIQ